MILLLLFFSRTNTFYEELPGKEQLGTENPPKTKPKSLNPNTHWFEVDLTLPYNL